METGGLVRSASIVFQVDTGMDMDVTRTTHVFVTFHIYPVLVQVLVLVRGSGAVLARRPKVLAAV